MDIRISRLGIYGGTFSPVHTGHVRAAHAFVRDMRLDRLLVMPSAIPPHKAAVEGASSADRLNMLRLAFRNDEYYKNGRLEISDYELSRQGVSYTVYTLRHFKDSYPDAEIFMLVGEDMFLTLDTWRSAAEIFDIADIAYIRRETDPAAGVRILEKKREYSERFGARIHELCGEPFPVSSTALRECLRIGHPADGLVDPAVADYIRKNNLY